MGSLRRFAGVSLYFKAPHDRLGDFKDPDVSGFLPCLHSHMNSLSSKATWYVVKFY